MFFGRRPYNGFGNENQREFCTFLGKKDVTPVVLSKARMLGEKICLRTNLNLIGQIPT
jgi:hypothetical protein